MEDLDFDILTTPDSPIIELSTEIDDSEIIKKEKSKNQDKKEEFNLKPVWSDILNQKDVKQTHSCLDITKIYSKKQEKNNKLKSFSACSSKKILLPGLLDFYRCTDGNRDYPGKQHISCALYHPSKALLITGTQDNLVCVFEVDGEQNTAVCKPIFLERFPIKAGRILPDGNRVVFHSKYNSFKIFDLTTSSFSHSFVDNNKVIIRRMEVSPAGDKLLFASKDGIIYIVSTTTFNVVDKLYVSGKVRALSFSHGGKYLYAFGSEAVVWVWQFAEDNYGKAVFVRKWTDYGCINGSSMKISPDDKYVACGSSTSQVSIYLLKDTWESTKPKPVKVIDNFGRVNLLEFNHSSELLAMGSCMEGGSQRLLHLGSMTLFSNFPGKMGTQRPTSFCFSRDDKYLAIGQSNGKVAMYNIKYYNK